MIGAAERALSNMFNGAYTLLRQKSAQCCSKCQKSSALGCVFHECVDVFSRTYHLFLWNAEAAEIKNK